MAAFYFGIIGCSTSPPNMAMGLLTQQNENRMYAFGSIDIAANLGKSEFVGAERVQKHGGDSIFPTYQSLPAGDLFFIVPIPWVLFSMYWNGSQPGAALGLNIYNWTSMAFMPTYSFVDRDWYVGYQVNQKLLKYAAISFTKYEEQLIAILPNQGIGEVGPIKRMFLNELSLSLSIQFEFFGFPMVYSAIPKYSWSKNGEIDGAGVSSVIGFNIMDAGLKRAK